MFMENLNSIHQIPLGYNKKGDDGMKCKFAFFIIILAVGMSLSFGKPILVMGEKAKSYLISRNQDGLKKVKRGNDVIPPKKAYIVSVDESSHKIYDYLKTFFQKTYRIQEIKNNTLRIKKDNVSFDISELETHRALCARKILEKIMPAEFVKQFMLVSVDTEQSFSQSQGMRIEGFRFNFSRVFNNRVVRSVNDFLVIRTDAKGVLKDAKISLQDLKNTSEIIKTDDGINENKETLDSLINEEFDVVKVFDQDGYEKDGRIEKIEVGSVTESYCEVFVGNTKKLFPCLSYASTIKLSNNEKIGYIIDAPHSRQSWRDYNHENKGSVRFNHYSH